MGRLVDEAYGACFVWGALIDGRYLHTGITFNVVSIFLLFIHMPIVMLLSVQVGDSYAHLVQPNQKSAFFNFKLVLYAALTLLQFSINILLYSAYGTLAFFTSFPFLWCIVVYANCWRAALGLTKSHFALEHSQNQQPLTTGNLQPAATSSDDSKSEADTSELTNPLI